jgi:N-acetylated-alpha-linked acidic dipeptidase
MRAADAKLQADFTAANAAALRFAAAGASVYKLQASTGPGPRLAPLNAALRDAETALLNQQGLPRRPWYKHSIYAPGEYTGYAAVVIPGVNEGIDAGDHARTQAQLDALAAALNRAAGILEGASR